MVDQTNSDEALAKRLHCDKPEDLYRPVARELMARLCRSFLEVEKLTPTEVVLSAKLQSRLSDAGTTYAGAVQRVAIPQVAGGKKPVSERIREIYALCDGLHAKTRAALEGFEPRKLSPDTVAGLFVELDALEEEGWRMIRLGASIAETLMGLKTWADRVGALIALIPHVPEERRRLFDQVLGEALRSPDALKATLGEAPTPTENIQRLCALVLGEARMEDAPATPPLARGLYTVLATGAFADTRAALNAHLMHAIGGGGSLSGSKDDETELRATAELRAKLMRDGQIFGGEVADAAFEAREYRLVNERNVEDWTLKARTVPEKLRLALDLFGRLSGERSRQAVRAHIDFLMQERPVEGWLVPPGTNVFAQVRAVADLHAHLARSALPEVFRGKLLARLELVQDRLVAETDLLGRLEKRSQTAPDATITLLDMLGGGAFIKGPAADAARRMADKLVKRPEFLSGYLGAAVDENEMRRRAIALKEKLEAAGLAN